MSEDEGFLQRWSRRKQAALQDDEPDEAERADSAQASDDPAVPETAPSDGASEQLDAASAEVAEPEPEPPGDEDMPPLESIDKTGDVSPFFSPRVSNALRQAALRRLFRQPKYNVVDMLDDYAEDYSKPALLGNIVTADMRYRAEQAAKRVERLYKESLAKKDAADSDEALVDEASSGVAGESGHAADGNEQDAAVTDEQGLADPATEPASSDQETPEGSDPKPV
ncbi:MAG: DUF3306 domain-containing protein [Wenzhouxiangella sp.]